MGKTYNYTPNVIFPGGKITESGSDGEGCFGCFTIIAVLVGLFLLVQMGPVLLAVGSLYLAALSVPFGLFIWFNYYKRHKEGTQEGPVWKTKNFKLPYEAMMYLALGIIAYFTPKMQLVVVLSFGMMITSLLIRYPMQLIFIDVANLRIYGWKENSVTLKVMDIIYKICHYITLLVIAMVALMPIALIAGSFGMTISWAESTFVPFKLLVTDVNDFVYMFEMLAMYILLFMLYSNAMKKDQYAYFLEFMNEMGGTDPFPDPYEQEQIMEKFEDKEVVEETTEVVEEQE